MAWLLRQEVSNTLAQLSRLEQSLGTNAGAIGMVDSPAIQAKLTELSAILVAEFGEGAREDGVAASVLQRRLDYQKSKCGQLEQELADVKGDRQGGRIAAMWFIRVGLSPPTIAPRTLRDFLRDFPKEEAHAISDYKISQAKDAFCQLIKRFVGDGLRCAAAEMASSCPIFLPHLVDEASMRVRNYVSGQAAQARSRSSKVRSNTNH